MASQQLMMWQAAQPALPAADSNVDAAKLKAVPQGHNAFSSLYLLAMRMVWDRMEDRELGIKAEPPTHKREVDVDGIEWL